LLGPGTKSFNETVLDRLKLENPQDAADFEKFALNLLQPFSSATSTWSLREVAQIRKELVDLIKTLQNIASSGNVDEREQASVRRSLIAAISASAFRGQRTALSEEIAFGMATRPFPSIAVNTSTYLEAHSVAVDSLPKDTSQQHIVLGVTGLLPSLWFNNTFEEGSEHDHLYIGVEHKEVFAYRKLVEQVKARPSVRYSRLILAAHKHRPEYLQYGLFGDCFMFRPHLQPKFVRRMHCRLKSFRRAWLGCEESFRPLRSHFGTHTAITRTSFSMS
jgi:hypothetical protein